MLDNKPTRSERETTAHDRHPPPGCPRMIAANCTKIESEPKKDPDPGMETTSELTVTRD
jgi:hypothetical protein